MVQLSTIEAQLTKLGVKQTFFCRPEVRELRHILMDHEGVVRFVNGRYHGGFAILVATEQRLLLIDKKPLYLTVEDIRYDMISEVDISARLFDATVIIFTVNKQLSFSAVRQRLLRNLTAYVQRRVTELRQYHPETPAQAPVSAPQDQVSATTIATPPQVTSPPRHYFVPSIDLHQIVGSAALRGSRRHNPNPYTKAPLMIRRQWTTWSPPEEIVIR